MQITRNSLDTGTGPNDWFAGSAYIKTIAAAGSSCLSASSVQSPLLVGREKPFAR
jgi:hypothetical protein